jgi:hypothetical protein
MQAKHNVADQNRKEWPHLQRENILLNRSSKMVLPDSMLGDHSLILDGS